MKKTIIIISSILIVAFVSGNVFAWGQGKGRGMGSGYNQDCPRYGGQSAFNDLSKDQRNALTTLRQTFVDETYEVRSGKFVKRQEMRMLMETSDPDRAKLEKLSREITDLQKQIRDKRIDFQLDAKKISPELGMGKGFRQGPGKWSKRGGQRGFQGQGNGCYYNNN
ncbi:periplasmic heavy metal sensor [Desulfobacula sp.]|uniref:periplasmic heavy metal sensor n=1 Tax=Desulfobacula sp. TaxID=2593537 RepID=UPI0026147147|nr:periplasmic heavy metal sensor [Desulfobacula sp.]